MKTSKDSRDVFAVFREDSFMKDASFLEKFKYWFKNVYLFHFGKLTLALVAVVIFAGMLISDIVSREYNDVDYILAGSLFANTEQMAALSDVIAGFVPQESEEEAPKIGHQMLSTDSIMGTGEQAAKIDEYNAASIDQISVSMANDEILLFLFDKRYAEWYAKAGAFEPLENLGIESDNEFFIRIDEHPLIAQLGIKHRDGIYAGIKIKTESRMKKERIAKKYENAIGVLSALSSNG